jgi:hypothetical protein
LPKYTTATFNGRLKLPTQEQTSRKNHEMRDSRAQREEDVLSLSLERSQRASAAIAHSTECSTHLRSGVVPSGRVLSGYQTHFGIFKPFYFQLYMLLQILHTICNTITVTLMNFITIDGF